MNTNLTQFWEQIQNEVSESPLYHGNNTVLGRCVIILPSTYVALFPSRTYTSQKLQLILRLQNLRQRERKEASGGRQCQERIYLLNRGLVPRPVKYVVI